MKSTPSLLNTVRRGALLTETFPLAISYVTNEGPPSYPIRSLKCLSKDIKMDKFAPILNNDCHGSILHDSYNENKDSDDVLRGLHILHSRKRRHDFILPAAWNENFPPCVEPTEHQDIKRARLDLESKSGLARLTSMEMEHRANLSSRTRHRLRNLHHRRRDLSATTTQTSQLDSPSMPPLMPRFTAQQLLQQLDQARTRIAPPQHEFLGLPEPKVISSSFAAKWEARMQRTREILQNLVSEPPKDVESRPPVLGSSLNSLICLESLPTVQKSTPVSYNSPLTHTQCQETPKPTVTAALSLPQVQPVLFGGSTSSTTPSESFFTFSMAPCPTNVPITVDFSVGSPAASGGTTQSASVLARKKAHAVRRQRK